MFYGEFSHVLDGKFRITVPKDFQAELAREGGSEATGSTICFLTRGQDGCLCLFTVEGFDRTIAGLEIAAFNGQNERAAQRVFFANTARLELDAQGRILVPEKLRPLLGGEKEVVFVGAGDHAEIWGRETWTRYHGVHEPILDSVDQVLGVRRRAGPGP